MLNGSGFGTFGAITEVVASTGALVRVLSTSRDGFVGAWAMAADGADLFVLDLTSPHGAGGILEYVCIGAYVTVVP